MIRIGNKNRYIKVYLDKTPDLIKYDNNGQAYITFHTKNNKAHMNVFENNLCILLKGSERNKKSSTTQHYKEKLSHFEEEAEAAGCFDENNILQEDIFTSTSIATILILRYSEESSDIWVNDAGVELMKYRDENSIIEINSKAKEKNKKDMNNTNDIDICVDWDSNTRNAKYKFSEDFIQKVGCSIANEICAKLKDVELQINKVKIQSSNEYIPDKVYIKPTNKLLLPECVTLDDIISTLKSKKAIMFVGAPGSGKTSAAHYVVYEMLGHIDATNQVLNLSINQETVYTSTIGGLTMNINGDWEISDGSIMNFLNLAVNNPDKAYFLILDEINRGNISNALGEMITAMSQRNIPVTTNTGKHMIVPNNLYIIGTMNIIDTSTSHLDSALLDRFAIFNMNGSIVNADSIKPNANESLKEVINRIIESINKINDILSSDESMSIDNQVGIRDLYSDYSDIKQLYNLVKFSIKPHTLDKASRMIKEDNITHVHNEINNLLKYIEDKINE